jgi:DNA polymerase-3 subunit alpha
VSPDNFLHLADINALSRPGPLFSGVAAEYVARKHGRHEIERLHPIVDRVTDFTYGTIVYQEQVLTIIKELGGFPVAKVGDIRRIISQKLGEASMNNMREEFQSGARRLHGIKQDLSGRIWRQMVTSANYSFNIAHCISYSMLGFWCMWLKVHHPLAFYAAQLAKVNDDKRPRLMKDALDHHISILPPHPARSGLTWTPVKSKNAVRAGLTQMPGIADKKGEAMISARWEVVSRQGYYKTAPWDWDDYLAVRGIGKKTIDKMKAFAADPDPFGLLRVRTTLENYRAGIRGRRAGYRGLPTPTHTSGTMPDGAVEQVVWMGFCLSKNYQNAVEKERTRTGRDEADILKELRDPHLLDSCVLRCYDDGPEDVYLRVNRWSFPELAEALEEIVPNEDIVICLGFKRENDFGVSLQVTDLIVVAPDEDELGTDYVKEEEDGDLEEAV